MRRRELNSRLLLGIVAGALAVAVLLLISVAAAGRPSAEARTAEALNRTFEPRQARPEDLFLGDEPDFLPPVMLFRTPAERWTAEDAQAFWIDPAERDREYWRGRIRATADALLEAAP